MGHKSQMEPTKKQSLFSALKISWYCLRMNVANNVHCISYSHTQNKEKSMFLNGGAGDKYLTKSFCCQCTQQSSPPSPHQQSSPLSLLQKSPWIQPAEA